MPERIRVLHGITSAMVRILELDRLLPEIVRSARALASSDAASLMLIDEAGEVLRIVAQHGLSDEYAQAQRVPIERANAIYAGFDQHVEIDLRASPAGDPALIEREGLARVIAMPLVHEGALIGAINIYTRDPARRFDEIDVEILHILAAQASIAITNARLYHEERSARRLQDSLLESVADGVLIGFPDGTLRVNRAAREIFGIALSPPVIVRSELARQVEVRRAEDRALVQPGNSPLDRALRGERVNGVFTFRAVPAGSERTVVANAEPVYGREGAVVAGVVTVHDVTEQREAERQKDEFVSIVSHELKTPLTPLKALAQLLRLRLRRHREEGRPLDLESLETNLRTIERQVDRMTGLVNDLLEVSRAGQGRFELQPTAFDLMSLVREVVQRQTELAGDDGRHRFVVHGPGSLEIRADATRLEQAVANLVTNAVKYSPNGGEVRVGVEPHDAEVAIAVSDDGIGIGPDDIASLGRPFARGSKRARTFSGMGIGLYLARLVAERHGGSLVLRSEGEDKGATVTIAIPRDRPS